MNTRSQRVRRCAASTASRSTWSCARDARRPFGRCLEAPGSHDRHRRQLFSAGCALLEQRELARDRAARPLFRASTVRRLGRQRRRSRRARARGRARNGGEDHDVSLEALLEHPEHAADDLARQRPARSTTAGSRRWRLLPFLQPKQPPSGARSASSASRPGGRSSRRGISPRALAVEPRAVLREQRASQPRLRRRRRQAPMRESGGRMRVCTTGVGTPDSLRIVTAASPVPSWVSSSSRSYASDFGNVATVARSAFASSGVNARSACCAVAELAENVRRNVLRRLRDEEDADALRADQAHDLQSTCDGTPCSRLSKRRCASSRKKTSSRLVAVSDLGKLL